MFLTLAGMEKLVIDKPVGFKSDSKDSEPIVESSTHVSLIPRKSLRTNRFRPRFSLRTFFLLTTLFTLGLAILLRLERPRQLRIWIHRNGGRCELASERSKGPVKNWLRRHLPREYFDDVVSAKLRTLKNDEIVDRLDLFSKLTWLQMDNSLFDNDHLRSLSRMKWLEVLYLHNTSLNDVGMKHIAQIKMLRVLRIDRTQISDLAIEHLFLLQNLQVLYLNDNRLSEAAILKLGNLKQLKILHLENTGVGVEAIHELKGSLPNCLILGP
jgi:Leucine-rich repeat (LRR) protein